MASYYGRDREHVKLDVHVRYVGDGLSECSSGFQSACVRISTLDTKVDLTNHGQMWRDDTIFVCSTTPIRRDTRSDSGFYGEAYGYSGIVDGFGDG